MTKKEIVRTISDKTGLTQLQIKEIVQLTFEGIVETLLEDGRVELRNFGVFQVKTRKARQARNPRTGRQVSVPAKSVVVFKPGKGMEARVKLADEQGLAERLEKYGPEVDESEVGESEVGEAAVSEEVASDESDVTEESTQF